MAAKNDVNTIDIEKRRHNVLQYRTQGLSLRAIGLKLKVSYQTVANDLKETLAQLQTTSIEHAQVLRELELQRLDGLIEIASKQATKGDLSAIDRVLKLSQERSKLLGLYAPEQIKSEITYHIVDETE